VSRDARCPDPDCERFGERVPADHEHTPYVPPEDAS